PTLTVAVLDQVQTLLAQYCGESCGVTNPLGLITPEAIAQGNPILTQAQTLLGACSLTTIAEEDPVTYEESCRVDCESKLGTSACTLALVDLLNTRLPTRTGSVVLAPADQLRLSACFVAGYKPKGIIRVTDSLLPWPLIDRDS